MNSPDDLVDPERSCWGPTRMKSPYELKLIAVIDALAKMMAEGRNELLDTPSAARQRAYGKQYREMEKQRKAERAKERRRLR